MELIRDKEQVLNEIDSKAKQCEETLRNMKRVNCPGETGEELNEFFEGLEGIWQNLERFKSKKTEIESLFDQVLTASRSIESVDFELKNVLKELVSTNEEFQNELKKTEMVKTNTIRELKLAEDTLDQLKLDLQEIEEETRRVDRLIIEKKKGLIERKEKNKYFEKELGDDARSFDIQSRKAETIEKSKTFSVTQPEPLPLLYRKITQPDRDPKDWTSYMISFVLIFVLGLVISNS